MEKGSTSETGLENSKKIYPGIIDSDASKSNDLGEESKNSSKKSQDIRGIKSQSVVELREEWLTVTTKYKILQFLGQGSYGQVVLAKDI